jgi:hypothetical protein
VVFYKVLLAKQSSAILSFSNGRKIDYVLIFASHIVDISVIIIVSET